jgi:lactoylglutathione lyase
MRFGYPINHESDYGELETEETTLDSANHRLGANNHPADYVSANTSSQPLGIEIALVIDSVPTVHSNSVAVSAVSAQEPVAKPLGQTVSYIQGPDGVLIEPYSQIGS